MVERDPLDLVKKTRVRWVEHLKKYLGDIVGFATALMDQAGFYVMCYMADHWRPISIVPKQEQVIDEEPPFFETELEIEDKHDPQLTKEDPSTGTLSNIWFGPYTADDEIVQHIENRFKYYMELAIKKIENPDYLFPFK